MRALARVVLWLTAFLLATSSMIVCASMANAEPAPPEGLSWPRYNGWRSCPEPATHSVRAARQATSVVLNGDSLTRESREQLLDRERQAGWDISERCWGGTTIDWGVSHVGALRANDRLPALVVVALGTNDIWWAREDVRTGVDAMMRAFGPDTEVVWVGLSFDRAAGVPSDRHANRVLGRASRVYRNLTVAPMKQLLAMARQQRGRGSTRGTVFTSTGTDRPGGRARQSSTLRRRHPRSGRDSGLWASDCQTPQH